jgi:hypothetical protein
MQFKHLENLGKIRRTNGPGLALLQVDDKKSFLVSVTSILCKSSKNPNASKVWFHYCDKNKHNSDDCREISKFNRQKKACFEAKYGLGKKSLVFLFE